MEKEKEFWNNLKVFMENVEVTEVGYSVIRAQVLERCKKELYYVKDTMSLLQKVLIVVASLAVITSVVLFLLVV